MIKNNEENDYDLKRLKHCRALSSKLRKSALEYLEENGDDLKGDMCVDVMSYSISTLMAIAAFSFYKDDEKGKYMKEYINQTSRLAVSMVMKINESFDKNKDINN